MPILREGELDIISHSVEQTARLGARLGALLRRGDIICLSGDMGAGKTVFSAGIGRGWGTQHPLTSPTFNLVHQHRRADDNLTLYHLDCYRLSGPEDTDSIGFDDIVDSGGILIIEWAERILPVLPPERLWIELRELSDTRRSLLLEATGTRYQQLVDEFRRAAYGF